MTVIASSRPLAIGAVQPADPEWAIIRRDRETNAEHLHQQPFMVLRAATREEWIACVLETLGRQPTSSELRYVEGFHFYEISVD